MFTSWTRRQWQLAIALLLLYAAIGGVVLWIGAVRR